MTTLTHYSDEPAVRHWIDFLQCREEGKRAQAAVMLASMGARAKSAVPALSEALRDRSPDVRRMAAMALGEIGHEARSALPDLVQLLQDKHDGVRRRAVMALADLGPDARPAAPALIQAVKDPDPLVRRWAVATLGEIGAAPGAIPLLIATLADDDMKTRAVTAAALVKIGNPAVPHLLDALHHRHPTVRRYAVQTLVKIDSGPDIQAALLARLQDQDTQVAAAAQEALQRLTKSKS